MAPARKSGKGGLTVTLQVSPEKLRRILGDEREKEDSPVKDAPPNKDVAEAKEGQETHTPETNGSPAPASSQPAVQAVNGETISDSNPSTPGPSAMGPPGKKGTKRSAATNGEPKSRGKPGPKKKAKLDDDTGTGPRGGASHKLGPKASQGAINAGLRALDRSGKPCRKWTKGTFQLKSFTGITWGINRWKAPPKPVPEEAKPEGESADASTSGSVKENKEGTNGKAEQKSDVKTDEKTTNGVPNGTPNGIENVNGTSSQDVEMQSVPASSPPAPVPIAAAS